MEKIQDELHARLSEPNALSGEDGGRPTGSRVDVGEVYIHVDDWGGPRPGLVLAHPTGFLGAIWMPIIQELRRHGFHRNILTFDQRGHGRSAKPDSGYSWDRFVSDTIVLIERLDIDGAVGIGHSAGATTLACAAAQKANAFRRLIMIDPILFDPFNDAEIFRGTNPLAERTRGRRLVWQSRDELMTSYRERFPYDTWTEESLRAYVDYGTFDRPDGTVELWCPGRIEAQVYENAASMDVFGELAKVKIPVLLVRGEHSISFPVDRAERALSVLGDGRLTQILGATHYIPMERPAEVAQQILADFNA